MKTSKWVAACSTLLLAVSVLTARADDPKPAAFARASIVSVNDVIALATDLGIPLPGNPAAMIEGMFPFIGTGGLLTQKPVGVILVAGENLPQSDMSLIALPVAPKAASIASLAQAGGQAVANHPDMATVGKANFRRTTNYLLLYTGALDILSSINDDPFAKDYAPPTRIAIASVDLATARATAPTQYKAFLDKDSPTPGVSTDSQKASANAAKAFINSLDYASLAIARDDKDIHIQTTMRPFDYKGARKFPRPTFPADIVAQMHVAYPNGDSAKWLSRLIQQSPGDTIKPGPNATPDQDARAKALAIRAANLLGDADAQSLAVSIKAGKPIIYLVNQYVDDRDFAGEFQKILDDSNALQKDTGQTDFPTVSTYQSAAGKPITRVSVTDKGKQQGYVDFIQIGHVVTLTIAADDGKYLDAFASLPTNGDITDLCTGSIDLGAALKASHDSGKAPPLPADQLKEVTAVFAGQSITWTTKAVAETKDVNFDLAIPFPVLKEITKVATGIMSSMGGPGSGGPPGPATEQPPTPAPAPMQNQ